MIYLFIAGVQKKSDGDHDVFTDAGSTPTLGQISAEVIIDWDSCTSVRYFTYCLLSAYVLIFHLLYGNYGSKYE